MYFHKALEKYGFKNFGFEIIEMVEINEELNLREVY